MNDRQRTLMAVRAALGRRVGDDERLEARLRDHPRNLVPQRSEGDPDAHRDLFVDMAREAAATVDIVADATAVPEVLSRYLSAQNLPQKVVMAPDPALDAVPWDKAPLLAVRRGRTDGEDEVSVTGAFAAVAETGSLMMTSGPDHPTTLNFLPETHVAVLPAEVIEGSFEAAWDRLRAVYGAAVPRTVNFVTGPSRSADIEQTLQMGAHGPRRLHIILIDERQEAA